MGHYDRKEEQFGVLRDLDRHAYETEVNIGSLMDYMSPDINAAHGCLLATPEELLLEMDGQWELPFEPEDDEDKLALIRSAKQELARYLAEQSEEEGA